MQNLKSYTPGYYMRYEVHGKIYKAWIDSTDYMQMLSTLDKIKRAHGDDYMAPTFNFHGAKPMRYGKFLRGYPKLKPRELRNLNYIERVCE